MAPAPQLQVVETGRATVDPMHPMVCIAPAGRDGRIPGATQPPSRVTSARHSAGDTTLVVRPTSSGAAPSVTTHVTPASHAMRRQRFAEEEAAQAARHPRTRRTNVGPAHRSSTSRSTSTLTEGRCRRPGPLAKPGAAASHNVTRASARRCAVVLTSPGRAGSITARNRVTRIFARLTIQQSVDRDHPVEQLRHVQSPALVLRTSRRSAAITVEHVADVRNQRSKLARHSRTRPQRVATPPRRSPLHARACTRRRVQPRAAARSRRPRTLPRLRAATRDERANCTDAEAAP